jgi:plastocyanin
MDQSAGRELGSTGIQVFDNNGTHRYTCMVLSRDTAYDNNGTHRYKCMVLNRYTAYDNNGTHRYKCMVLNRCTVKDVRSLPSTGKDDGARQGYS